MVRVEVVKSVIKFGILERLGHLNLDGALLSNGAVRLVVVSVELVTDLSCSQN